MYFRHLKDPSSLWPGASASELSRRDFLKLTSIAGAGLTLGAMLPAAASAAAPGAAAAPAFAMPFVHIDPDNTVTVLSKHVEAGQGVWTGLPTIVAEELDASWSQMRVESAPAKVPMYGNFAFDPKGSVQGTGGSTAVANSWMQLRQAGATARAMLVQAAAAQWKVPVTEIAVSEGVVSHAKSGKKATFGELAARCTATYRGTHTTRKPQTICFRKSGARSSRVATATSDARNSRPSCIGSRTTASSTTAVAQQYARRSVTTVRKVGRARWRRRTMTNLTYTRSVRRRPIITKPHSRSCRPSSGTCFFCTRNQG